MYLVWTSNKLSITSSEAGVNSFSISLIVKTYHVVCTSGTLHYSRFLSSRPAPVPLYLLFVVLILYLIVNMS